ncbi:c-type cytochrome [Cupriavidus sp. WGtm5]|uniref:c-type cytochrome n=1 Tax=Cupriavidus sp. WGtm5 TaxID=2919926 RepID=UPI000E1063AA|nr:MULTISPECIES: c-type cytochrome [Cupriavidus]MCO4893151.1 c-type cytochrome [Cupriavidus sp. WGtm5]SPA41156.1 Cytochrome C [Cupriavidus taiwanensis]
MKKRILLGAAGAIVAGLLAWFGPDLLGLYRLDRYISASAAAYETNNGPWPHVTDACIACHGVRGNSAHQGYPSLAGQPAPYLAAQLHKFASGERPEPIMGPLAMTMSETEINNLADHFARQPAVDNRTFTPDAVLREKGRQLVAQGNCAACHGGQLMGREQFPRLAGQGYDYLLAQFDAFANGARSDPTGMMKRIATAASAQDRKAMATYLASLAPQKK